MNDTLVSIITPMYNSEKYISEMIESVLKQTYKEWELIIVDDCSTDNSYKIVNRYVNIDSRIRLIKLESNKGPSDARNVGIKNSNGRYIAFLDSDDLWKKNKLEVQINYMISNNEAVTCTSYEILSEGLEKKYGIFYVPNKITYEKMLKRNYFSCDTVIIDRNKINNYYMEYYERHEDYVTWLKIIKQVEYASGIKEVLATYRVYDNTRSSNKISNIIPQFKIYYNIEKLGLIKSLYYLVFVCSMSLIKYRGRLINKYLSKV